MKADNLFRKIIYSSAFLAAIPAVLFLLFLPPLGSKYSISVEKGSRSPDQMVYEDLNSDSIPEIVTTGKGLPFYFIAVRDLNLKFYDQWNLKDSLNRFISKFFFGNYDHDRFEEIYIFTHNKDSLFLNVNEFLEPHGTKVERIFITKIGYLNGEVLSVLYPAGFYDKNGDGKDELYFSITSAFGMGPRHVFSFDLVHKRLKSSKFTGTICMDTEMIDVDGDGRPEIFGNMSASGNFRKNIPYTDSSTWFMVFNTRLEFKFPPVEFPGYVNGLEIFPYRNGTFKGYVLSHLKNGTDSTVQDSRILTYSPYGKLIRYRLYSDLGYPGSPDVYVNRYQKSDRIYIIEDVVTELNADLQPLRKINLPFNSPAIIYQVDVNGDDEDEFLVYSDTDEKLVIYSGGFFKLSDIKFKTSDPIWTFSQYYSKDHIHKLFLKSGSDTFFIELRKNNLYYLGFLMHPGIYLISFLFISLVKRVSTHQVEERENLKQRLMTLQLQGIKSQLDPHFTFNALNSVASLIYLEDRQVAYDYMNKFTQLLRSMLNDAERVYLSLGEELDFVTTYLDLEKLRFGEKFNYEIFIGEGISQKEQVPKHVLQTFAENAVKHGIMPRSEGGLIKIRVELAKGYLKMTIEDNGIGRSKSAGQSTSTGKGLKLTTEFYNILNQMNKRPIRHIITDLINAAGNPIGTRVEVWVPVDKQA